MKNLFKIKTIAAIIIMGLACAFGAQLNAQCPAAGVVKNGVYTSVLTDFAAQSEPFGISVFRTESAVRSLPVGGNNYDYEAIVGDGASPSVTFVDYNFSALSKSTYGPFALRGTYNGGPDVRINRTASTAIIIHAENGSTTSSLDYDVYTSDISASNYGTTVKWKWLRTATIWDTAA